MAALQRAGKGGRQKTFNRGNATSKNVEANSAGTGEKRRSQQTDGKEEPMMCRFAARGGTASETGRK